MRRHKTGGNPAKDMFYIIAVQDARDGRVSVSKTRQYLNTCENEEILEWFDLSLKHEILNHKVAERLRELNAKFEGE